MDEAGRWTAKAGRGAAATCVRCGGGAWCACRSVPSVAAQEQGTQGTVGHRDKCRAR